MAGTTCDPPPRTVRRFPSQPRLSPVHGSLTVLAHPSTTLECCSGIRAAASACTSTPGAGASSVCWPPPYSTASGPARCAGAAPGGTQSPGCPPAAACMLCTRTSAFSCACRRTARRGHAPLAARARRTLPAVSLPAEGVLRRYGQRVLDRRLCLHPRPFPAVWHSRTRGSRRRTIPPHHTPSVPWGAASRRLPPGRCVARGAHCSGALDFPGFLGPHACPDPRSHAIDRGRIPGLATRPCGRGPAAVPSRTRGRAPTQH